MTKFTVSLIDPANLAGAFASKIVASVKAAADNWAAMINSTATIDISVDIAALGPNVIAQGGSATHFFPSPGKPFVTAQNDVIAKLVTGVDVNGAAADMRIELSQSYVEKLTYDLTQTAFLDSRSIDAVSVFEHEIGHGLGFNGFKDALSGAVTGSVQSTFDQYVQLISGHLYFTGANAQAVYHGPVPIEDGNYGHIGNKGSNPGSDLATDLMYGTSQPGVHEKISALDVAILKDIGVPVNAFVPPAAAASSNFSIKNTTTGETAMDAGSSYAGPVANIKSQFIYTGRDSLNVVGGAAGQFIHTGAGVDAIDVHATGGSNVLDGGTNSNFLTGGTAATDSDTFFVDNRAASGDIWSTVVNFHAGDAATIFGITPKGNTASWVDDQGAAGFQGLTLHVLTPGAPSASLTLAGYTSADFGNGRLHQTFGTEADGTPYLYIHGDK